ncbi:hypothetical protein NVP1251O_17 [Vibrio phage 1.251.O._10N.261.55.E5]|nr:hypothetical protein NVP1251O_17 [Vibrio phage 1.251.O._10N.261.55.E5]
MKNVREITSLFEGAVTGAIEAMEFGAILEVDHATGEGEIRYQGNTYHATKIQVDAYVHLPQVKHMRQGKYCIRKDMRQPFGEVTFYQDDEFRAKHL